MRDSDKRLACSPVCVELLCRRIRQFLAVAFRELLGNVLWPRPSGYQPARDAERGSRSFTFSLLRNRAHNDFLGDWLFAVPIGLTVRRYRAVHDLHHQALATEDDPSGFLVAEGVPRRVVIANLLFRCSAGRSLTCCAVSSTAKRRAAR